MADFEQPGSFYLGRNHDLAAAKTGDAPLLYDSAHLTTHAVCVGMTGSGKTGLCLSLLEEAALDGIPAIAIDPKGDLGNLLLAFPELQPSDFRPWVDPTVAARKGITVDQLAEQTAETWRNGLAQWGEDGMRIRRFTEAVDRTIYTPGSSAGVPLTILKSFAAPPQPVLDDADAFSDRIQGAASGLLALLGVTADPVNSREHILLSKVLEHAWREGRDLTLEALIHEIQQPPFKQVGAVPLDSFFPAKDRVDFGMKLNNLLASPSFAGWRAGESLDVERLLYTAEGKPRLSILSIAHLSDAERMFFVTILLNEVIAWMRSQPGTGSLRAILYMDEVFGYFPPTANPPSKRPMLTLMKQARAYGLGCVLATQNPVDLDYKGLSNAGTWFLGRLQTERDKARVIEGLEGASAEAGATFNRREMEAALAALDSRVFLMNNVHAAAPQVFHTRWAMSYLSGPLTRAQISTLMADRKAALTASAASRAVPGPGAPHKKPAMASPERSASPVPANRPMLSADITQRFWPIDPNAKPKDDAQLTYRPALLGLGKIHYEKPTLKLDLWQDFVALQSVHDELPTPPWDSAMIMDGSPPLAEAPQPAAAFAELAGPLAEPRNYRRWDDDLKLHLYQTQRLELFHSEELDAHSRPHETEADFRARLLPAIIEKVQKEVTEAELVLASTPNWVCGLAGTIAARSAEILASGVFGRRSRKQLVTQTAWGQTMRARQRRIEAKATLAKRQAELAKLQSSDGNSAAAAIKLEQVAVAPRKTDVTVNEVVLAWLPWYITLTTAHPAY